MPIPTLTRTEISIIDYLYENPSDKESFSLPYAAEIVKNTGLPKGSIYRNLESLEAKGLVKSIERGRMKFYELTELTKKLKEVLG